MKSGKSAAIVLSLGLLALGGCGEKNAAATEVPNQPENQADKPVPMEKYVVKKGDTLWAISRQQVIYSDSFEWPLIFKTDRDQIQDPDQIAVGQTLLIEKGQTAGQVRRAIKLASDTPKFTAHGKPRSPLPVDYF